jgi:hypothetical protein
MHKGGKSGPDQSPRKPEGECHVFEVTLSGLGGMVVKQSLQHMGLLLKGNLTLPHN